MPMLDPTKDPLTLAEIALHWSRETGVGYKEREILAYLLQAFWAGSVPDQPWSWDEASALDDLYGDDPDVASVARASAPVTAGVNTRSKSIQEEMFGFLCIVDRDMAEFIELHGGVPGAVVALAHSNLDRIDKKSLAILRNLTLTKAGLRAFCGGRHIDPPKFWFGEKPAVAEAAPTVPHQESDQPMASEASSPATAPQQESFPGRPSLMAAIKEEMKRRRKDGELEDSLAAECRSLASWAENKFPGHQTPTNRTIENSLRRVFKSIKPPPRN